MPIMFNSLLREAGLPLKDVRLLRHKDKSATKGRNPYELWRDDRPQFELYQSVYSIRNCNKLATPYWAVFVANLDNETMFTGLYNVEYRGLLEHDTPRPEIEGGIDKAGSRDSYDLTLNDALCDLIGRLFIDWGPGALAWVQHAEKHDKPITELRSDYQVSILEVAGSSATDLDIEAMEGRWQRKLQSKDMGLNRNLARRL